MTTTALPTATCNPDGLDVNDEASGGAGEMLRESRSSGWRSLLAGISAYFVAAIALWWQVWSTHPTSTTTCGCGDTSLFTWFLEWPAYAISHGLNPLYSNYLFHPGGINLLSNTAEVGLGIVLAPVTWIFGPIATLNVALTLSPFLSACAAYVLLRRWVAWAPAAWIGGLLYGFSPFVIVSLTDAHLMLGMALVPPLVVLCLDEILVRQRWRPWIAGLALAACATVQLFVGTEMLVIITIGAAVGLVLVVAVAALWRRTVLIERAPYALRALVIGAVASVVVLAWPAWFALAGPAHLAGDVWGSNGLLAYGGNAMRYFASPMPPAPRITALTHQLGGYQGPSLSGQFFGIGLLAVLAVGLVAFWRDVRLWLFAVMGVIAALLSEGLSFHGWTLWRLFVRLPLMSNVIPSRFVVITYLCAAVMLAVILDRIRTALADRVGLRRPTASAGALVLAAVCLVPIATYLDEGGLPLTAVPVRLPPWFATAAPHLPEGEVLLVFPFAFRQSNMTWQAVNRMSYAMAGGGGPNSLASRAGKERAGQTDLSNISLAGGPSPLLPDQVTSVRSALAGWGVTGVVLPNPDRLPLYEQVFLVRSIVVLMTAATGQVPRYEHQAWVWSGIDRSSATPTPTPATLARCAEGPQRAAPADIAASAACVLTPESAP